MAQRALLVGVNRYGDREIPPLYGCVNDVSNLRHVLLTCGGFDVSEVRLLVDGRATLENVRDRLRWLVDGARAGDRLVLYFAGHGSRIRTRIDDELAEHIDEILCLHDMHWDGGYLANEELRSALAGVPSGTLVEVLLDTCHVGSG